MTMLTPATGGSKGTFTGESALIPQNVPPILVIDLEATCADDGSIPPEQMEVIEIGAAWVTPEGQVLDTMQRFVRPLMRPELTVFCQTLTRIDQVDIDTASTWPVAAAELADFARRHVGQGWGSWGAYDLRQIERECVRHEAANPLDGLSHSNLKATFAKARKIKQVGMTTALKIVGLQLSGRHHRALDDVLNIAKLLPEAWEQ